mmetsp:Transcript_13520/g.43200  ORF Transcript_13520/g.43200 Transcript_13520/m.43200 type:complete len:81 (+) Transcript_13520:183-425(+)
MVAACHGHAEVVQGLLANEVDEFARNEAGSTALQIAEEFDQDHIVQMLRHDSTPAAGASREVGADEGDGGSGSGSVGADA